MKKKIFLMLACLVSTVQAFASGCCDTTDSCNPCCAPSDCCLDFDSKIVASVGGGLRWDSIGWKTTASGFSSDSFHQKWRDIKLGVIEANVAFVACDHYLLKGNFDYGWVYGKNKLSTNRFGSSSDFSCSSNFSSHSKNGHAYDLSAGVGYVFNFECWPVSIAPLVGYSYNVMNLRRSSFDVYNTPISGESSCSSSSNGHSHKFRLSGPWLGFGTTYQATCEILVYLDYAFHWANFRATLDEGLAFYDTTLDFSKSFKSRNAYGNEVTIGGLYTLCDCWFAGLKFNYKNWYTSKKHHHNDPYDSSFCSSNSSSSGSSRFRNLDWNTCMVTVDIGYTF